MKASRKEEIYFKCSLCGQFHSNDEYYCKPRCFYCGNNHRKSDRCLPPVHW